MTARTRRPDAKVAVNRGVKIPTKARFLEKVRAHLVGWFTSTLSAQSVGDVSYFTNTRESTATTKNRGIKVMPFVVNDKGETIYWFALGFNFDDTPGDAHVREASIKVFAGLESDGIKRLVFRAEWRAVQSDSEKHGQPHWHFHEDTKPQREDAPKALLERFETLNVVPSWKDAAKASPHYHMHYPMASLFHENNADCVVRAPSEKQLRDWIRLTVEYVQRELRDVAA